MVLRYCLGMIMSVSTLIIFSGAATPSRCVNFSIGPIPCQQRALMLVSWRFGARRSSRSRYLSGLREMGLANHGANLDVILAVKPLAGQFLRLAMLRVHARSSDGLLGCELDDGDPLAVVGEE